MSVATLIADIRKGSPLGTLIGMMKNVFGEKAKANEIYVEVVVVLDELLMQGYRFESSQVQAIVSVLQKLPAAGAQRRNFEKLYLQDEYTLRKLPKDPRNIPKGHWHY